MSRRRALVAYDQGAKISAEVNVTGLAGSLLAKTAAASGRHKSKDYYDIAFVLLHRNEVFDDEGGTLEPADVVLRRLGAPAEMRSAIEDLAANFADDQAQGVEAYVDQLLINTPRLDPATAATDAQLAVGRLHHVLAGRSPALTLCRRLQGFWPDECRGSATLRNGSSCATSCATGSVGPRIPTMLFAVSARTSRSV